MTFQDRADAGRQLGQVLLELVGQGHAIVLALPRGGVPVAAEVAVALHSPLDVFIARKLGAPGNAELALGAIAEGGIDVRHHDAMTACGVSDAELDDVAARERLELDRRVRLYRGPRERLALEGRTVVLVDDGLATGSTMEAAVSAVRAHRPADVVVAVPVGAPDTCLRLSRLADRFVCLVEPPGFRAVGEWYTDFSQTTDDEVKRILSAAGTA